MTALATRVVGAPVDRIEGRLKVTGEARYAVEYPRGRRLRRRSSGRRSPAAASATSTPRRRSPCPACSPCWARQRAARWPTPASPELAVLQTREVAYRGQIVAAVVADTSRPRARPPRLVRGRPTTREPHDVGCATDHPTLVRAGQGQPDLRRPTPSRATSTPALAARQVRRRDVHAPRRSTTTRWSRTPRWRSGTDGDLHAVRLQPGRARWRATLIAKLFGLEPERVRVRLRARRRRLRLQGPAARRTAVLAAMAAQAVRPAGEGRADPAADVRAHRLPHADDPADPARRRRRRAAARRSPTTSSSRRSTVKEFAEQTAVGHAA